MRRSTSLVITAAAIILILIGILAFSRGNDDEPASTPQTTTTETNTPANKQTSETKKSAATITYNGNLFSPSQVTVQKDDTVTVKNESSKTIDFESDPHPTHTNNLELNVGEIAAGEATDFTVTQVGSWGYHNHLDQTQTGTVVAR